MHDPETVLSLHTLSPDELDELPFGVIQVDGAGRVRLYNRTESLLSGLSPARVIGRDFFREIAPCTHLPAFHGRFLEGLHRGKLDTEFEFVFSFDPPIPVRVYMISACEPDRYWILVHKLGTVDFSLHRRAAAAAQETVDRQSRAEPIDASSCAREAIHLPGGVQPHVALLAVDPVSLVVHACSANIAESTGLDPAAALGRPLGEILPGLAADAIVDPIGGAGLPVADRRWPMKMRLGDHSYMLSAHGHDGRLIIELEMLTDRPEDFGAAAPTQAQNAVARMRAAASLGDAAQRCAEDVRAMTGFERVLIYRFDADWNGEAVGESRDDGYSSLLGLRFPASDIPAQARALYTQAPSRFVVDRDAVPSPIVAAPGSDGRAVDLSCAYSRALSPIHLEYQRNLGVNGSMSISIVVEGALWGLVIGHHRRPHYVSPDTRALAGLVTDAFALRIHELATTLAWREQQGALHCQNALLRQLAGADDYVSALADPAPGDATLCDLFDATGAAVVDGDRIATIGTAPAQEEIAALADWLRGRSPAEERTFATADLSQHWPPAAAWRTIGSGLLAAAVDAERLCLLLWFRPEVAAAVAWGGDPNKPVLADATTRTLLPRRSFERWIEERRRQAEPWASWHVGYAGAFAAAVEGVVLRQGRKIEELSAKERVMIAALEQKEVLTREIDHRVKNSLQFVASILLLQTRRVADPDAKTAFQNAYGRVMSIARVHDSLRQSDSAATADLGETLRRLCADLSGGIADAGYRIDVDAEAGLMVPSRTAVALAIIATELVTNALRYAYPSGNGGSIRVQVRAHREGGLQLVVADEGCGLPADWEGRSRESGALGLRVIGAMLEQIGATLSTDSDRGRGARFTVTA